jgi:hypothetical protein
MATVTLTKRLENQGVDAAGYVRFAEATGEPRVWLRPSFFAGPVPQTLQVSWNHTPEVRQGKA